MGVEFNFQSTGEHYRVFCRSFGVEKSFVSALGPKLDFLALGSYAGVLAHCAPPPPPPPPPPPLPPLGLWALKKIEVRFLLLKKIVQKFKVRFLLLK